jgi:hypothetical protein
MSGMAPKVRGPRGNEIIEAHNGGLSPPVEPPALNNGN